jgi:hypothetical protein
MRLFLIRLLLSATLLEKKMSNVKDLTLGLIFLSISLFFLTAAGGVRSLVGMAEIASLQQENIHKASISAAEIIGEGSLMGAALVLEKMGLLERTESDEIVLTSIENIGNLSERLEVILTAVNNRLER